MSTAKRIAKRKAERENRAERLAANQTAANQRHARQRAADVAPAIFVSNPWFDSDHEYEAFGVAKWKTEDTDCWPAGFRGQLGFSGTGLEADQASALREKQFKQQLKQARPEYKKQVIAWLDSTRLPRPK